MAIYRSVWASEGVWITINTLTFMFTITIITIITIISSITSIMCVTLMITVSAISIIATIAITITPSPPTKSLGFRGFDSSKLLILKGGNSHVRIIL